MSAIMVDTDALSIAVLPQPPAGRPDDLSKWMAMQQVLNRGDDVLISAIVWFELHRKVLPNGDTLADRIASKVHPTIEQVDLPVVELAAKLFRRQRGMVGYCDRCLSVAQDKPCTACNRLCSVNQKTNDLIIVAHAHHLPWVHTLYSFDTGVHAWGGTGALRVDLKVVPPPNPHGQLFAQATPPTAP